jgi:hypothetical protein
MVFLTEFLDIHHDHIFLINVALWSHAKIERAVVKPDLGVAKSVLSLFPVEHTSALDHAVIGNALAKPPSTGRSNRIRCSRRALSGTVRLGLSWDRQDNQNSLNRHGDKGGEQWRLEKLGFGENKVKLIMTFGWYVSINHDPLYLQGGRSCPANSTLHVGIKLNS